MPSLIPQRPRQIAVVLHRPIKICPVGLMLLDKMLPDRREHLESPSLEKPYPYVREHPGGSVPIREDDTKIQHGDPIWKRREERAEPPCLRRHPLRSDREFDRNRPA